MGTKITPAESNITSEPSNVYAWVPAAPPNVISLAKFESIIACVEAESVPPDPDLA